MENNKNVLYVALALIVGVVVGFFLANSNINNSNQGARAIDIGCDPGYVLGYDGNCYSVTDTETSKTGGDSKEMVTITVPKSSLIPLKDLEGIAKEWGLPDGAEERPRWLCRLLGGVYVNGSCYWGSHFRTVNGLPEEVTVDGIHFSQLTKEDIYRITEEKGYSSDPNLRPYFWCRLFGGTVITVYSPDGQLSVTYCQVTGW